MKKILYIIPALLLITHFFLLIYTGFTAWPEMTFWPYLILKGWLPYKDIAIAHTPILLGDLTIFFKIFGTGLMQLKIYTWILILGTDLLVYWVFKKLWDRKVALVSLLVYVPLQLYFEGNGLWFDLALAPLALVIYYLLEKKNYLWAGVWWGIAFLTKQTAFWFLIPILYTFLRHHVKDTPLHILRRFIIGAGIVGVISFMVLRLLGIWGDFWLWAIKFGITKLPSSSGQMHLPTARQFIIATFPFLLLTLSTIRIKKSFKILVWAIFASLGVIPRWELFHFQPALPFLAIGLSLALINFKKLKLYELIILGVGLVLVSLPISRQLIRYWEQEDRFYEPAVLKTAQYIKENSEKNDKIYIANAWDNLYVLTDTVPALRPWIPFLPWYIEIPGIEDVMVANLSIYPPKLIVEGEYQGSGLGAYKPEQINGFIMDNYSEVEEFDSYLIYKPKK